MRLPESLFDLTDIRAAIQERDRRVAEVVRAEGHEWETETTSASQ
jgi:hypothetical protein